MPAIDSKHVVALLVELEPVIGCDLPCSLARAGGYPSRLLLVTDLLARIRAQCLDTPTPTDQNSAADVRDAFASTPDTADLRPIGETR